MQKVQPPKGKPLHRGIQPPPQPKPPLKDPKLGIRLPPREDPRRGIYPPKPPLKDPKPRRHQ